MASPNPPYSKTCPPQKRKMAVHLLHRHFRMGYKGYYDLKTLPLFSRKRKIKMAPPDPSAAMARLNKLNEGTGALNPPHSLRRLNRQSG